MPSEFLHRHVDEVFHDGIRFPPLFKTATAHRRHAGGTKEHQRSCWSRDPETQTNYYYSSWAVLIVMSKWAMDNHLPVPKWRANEQPGGGWAPASYHFVRRFLIFMILGFHSFQSMLTGAEHSWVKNVDGHVPYWMVRANEQLDWGLSTCQLAFHPRCLIFRAKWISAPAKVR